ncbi:Protein ANTI-SILENCING 1 [Linum grandiflorum]
MGEIDEQGCNEIRWTSERRLGGKNKDISFYDSFVYEGEEYRLYDSVYVYTKDEDEPEIGKLLKAWETANGEKKARILWFFRPRDIANYFQGENDVNNELFLAAGEGKGLVNNNPLEAIAGKCNVICTSRDIRNPQPSKEQIIGADFVFSRCFDVGRCKILEKMDEKIGGIEGIHFYTSTGNAKRSTSPPRTMENSKIAKDVHARKEGLKKNESTMESSKSAKLPKPSQVHPCDASKRIDNRVSEMPVIVSCCCCCCHGQLWEEDLQAGYEDGSLVLLLNLNPSYTSVEVQELIKDSCMETCTAKMVQRTAFSNPHSGKALVKFMSKEAAERVISKLAEGCLLLPGGRCVMGRIMTSGFKGKQSPFYGHFGIDRLTHKLQRDKKTAVSTSHCSQPNTIEYEMALEWCLLQTKMQKSWESVHKQHGDDVKKLKDRLTSTLKIK